MKQEIVYPRRQFIRGALKLLAKAAFWLLCDLKIEGKENLPESGPLLVIGNHFSFIDPVAVLSTLPYSIEFVGGAVFPHAPKIVQFIPQIWGYYPVFRGIPICIKGSRRNPQTRWRPGHYARGGQLG